MTTRAQIDQFLSLKRLAMVGVSRDPKHFSRGLFRELRGRQYDVVPVNPDAAEVDGVACQPSVGSITPAVQGALLMTRPAVTDQVVRECHAAGILYIWMYRAVGAGAVSPAAVQYCQANGMTVVAGECPFQFLPETAWFHRLHGYCRQLAGTYPR